MCDRTSPPDTFFYGLRGSVFVDGDGGSGGFFYAVADEEGIDGGILTAEITVKVCGIACAATLKYVAAETVGCLAVEYTVFLEFGESIGIKHLGPLV